MAREALDLIQVDYAPLPAVIDPLQAMRHDTPVVHQELASNRVLRITSAGGDVDAAFAQADHVVRQSYQVQRLATAPMENRGVVADYQPQDDLLTVWDSTQNPHGMKAHLAQLLGRPESSVRVVTPDVGGGFGEKGCLFPEEVSIAYLAIHLGRPVKWVEERRENLLAFHGRGHHVEVEAAAQHDGPCWAFACRLWPTWAHIFSSPRPPCRSQPVIASPDRIPRLPCASRYTAWSPISRQPGPTAALAGLRRRSAWSAPST